MPKENPIVAVENEMSFEEFKSEILNDFRIANISREASILGRKEVLTGKAKFGIFGDCLLYTSPSPRDVEESRMPSSA